AGALEADTRDSVCCSMENVANELPVAIDLTAGSQPAVSFCENPSSAAATSRGSVATL
ncbi:MAG: hypothetical protein QOD85_1716, partial [Gaiellaceae bacterium]|nr:hypothetical protein [Gaiellaceae bacterium]